MLIKVYRMGEAMAAQFDMWDPLLQMIADAQPTFLSSLTEELANALAFTARPDQAKTDVRCEGAYLWLDHILGSAQWESRRRLVSYAYMLAVCEQVANHWTDLLKERLAERQDEEAPSVDGEGSGRTTRSAATTRKMVHNADVLYALKRIGIKYMGPC